ncbi:LysR substrate-binding domain-containing protein [Phreatobacter oligotrophus]|nr:LysR substrate-binding domain-containing protein [Phreatobacter oligotrophus]
MNAFPERGTSFKVDNRAIDPTHVWIVPVRVMRQPPHLPNLPSLRAFEAVGRLQSFRAAGQELLITQSAVSHHIRNLETDLGVRLFVREARGIRFTLEGERYFQSVTEALTRIALATEQVRTTVARGKRVLRLSVLPSFGRFWLAPRLPTWAQDHPDIDLRIDPSLALSDVSKGECDLAIRYGIGPWPGCNGRLLVPERLSPIVSQAFAKTLPPAPTLDDLASAPRILNSTTSDWERWRETSVTSPWRGGDSHLTEYGLVVDTVLAGHGLAMGRLWLLSDLLRTERLLTPLADIAAPSSFGYWLLKPLRSTNPAGDVFERWLVSQID